jgi:excinuclease ABC subunit A
MDLLAIGTGRADSHRRFLADFTFGGGEGIFMASAPLVVKGAREHNLKNIELVLPRNRLICFTGVSGSGKSSLAYDTLYAEGQRRYIQSLSTYARQFLDEMPKPDVDQIVGLSPAICISQKTGAANPRSTVGTLTEIYDFLRLLYARVGMFYCPDCSLPIGTQSIEQVVTAIRAFKDAGRLFVLAPVVRQKKGEFRGLLENFLRRGYERVRIDGEFYWLNAPPLLDRRQRHDIEIVVGEVNPANLPEEKLRDLVSHALQLGEGELVLFFEDGCGDGPSAGEHSGLASGVEGQAGVMSASDQRINSRASSSLQESGRSLPAPLAERSQRREIRFFTRNACGQCGQSFPPLSPQLFSFNHPAGACPECNGLGEKEGIHSEETLFQPELSLRKGAFRLFGPFNRWPIEVQEAVSLWAAELERRHHLPEGAVLNERWRDLPEVVRQEFLWGLGEGEGVFLRPASSPAPGTGQQLPPVVSGRLPLGFLRAFNEQWLDYLDSSEIEHLIGRIPCWACNGQRLNRIARSVRLRTSSPKFESQPELNICQLSNLPITEVIEFLEHLALEGVAQRIAEPIVRELQKRLGFLVEVGVGYLTLDRPAPTLAGGEMQRIRLAAQLGRRLSGVLYVLDEPSIGLHPRDNARLLRTLKDLRDQGNTVIVVEHDEQTIRSADYVVDFGPGAGVRGGHIVGAGPLSQLLARPQGLTAQYLVSLRSIPIPARRRPPGPAKLVIRGACHNNLKNIDVEIPLGLFVCVTGVSGSGKSSLVEDIIVQLLRRELHGAATTPGKFREVEGLEHIRSLIAIDQSPIGRTPRSNPATYTKIFDDIRQLFAELPEAKLRGFKAGRFSFNVVGGRCEACAGNGAQKLEMDFMMDLWIRCPVCEGRRFNADTLSVRFKGYSIADVLEMDVAQAMELFANIPHIRRKLETLHAVGLDYLKLGQPSTTLSGGEAQRIKLSRELVKRARKGTLYVLDEPTTGLHFADVELLVRLLRSLVEGGSTVLVVEHNLEVIKCADWIIDLGPEGGEGGGYIVATGTPEEVAEVESSYTGRALREVLARDKKIDVADKIILSSASPSSGDSGSTGACGQDGQLATEKGQPATGTSLGHEDIGTVEANLSSEEDFCGASEPEVIAVRGAREHNLKDISVDIPREKLVVLCGPSGSGKSSLAIDTLYAEGRRRYLESLNTYARQFLGQVKPPEVERIEGLMPAVAIEQKGWGSNPRSTVGTITEIYDFLRVLYARQGVVYCPRCRVPTSKMTQDELVARLAQAPEGAWAYLLAPLSLQGGQNSWHLSQQIAEMGYQRIRIDGRTYTIDALPRLGLGREHTVEVVVDRVQPACVSRGRLGEGVEAALRLGRGIMRVAWVDENLPETRWKVQTFSQFLSCPQCGRGFEPLTPQHFSFNTPLGWCPVCQGHGVVDAAKGAEHVVFDPQTTVREILEQAFPLKTNPRLQGMVATICRRHGIPLEMPWGRLSRDKKRLLLYGSGPRTKYYLAPSEEELLADPKAKPIEFQFRGILAPSTAGLAEGLGNLTSGEEGEGQLEKILCPQCYGSRIGEVASAVRWRERTLFEVCELPLDELHRWLEEYEPGDGEKLIVEELLREIRNRVRFLVDVGLEYLTLSRPVPTLSGGEIQRIRLAAQLGSGLCGVLYVLDEPTIGLHPRDGSRLVGAIRKLRDLGNTVVVVEHDRQVMENADYILDFGPGAGRQGGQIVAQGSPAEILRSSTSVTGPFLTGAKTIPIPQNRRMPQVFASSAVAGEQEAAGAKTRKPLKSARRYSPGLLTPEGIEVPLPEARLPRPPGGGWLVIRRARKHNLKEIDVRIPLGTLTVVTGVSGSGKTTLVQEILYPALAHLLHRAQPVDWAACDGIEGLELIDKVIRVDQRPIGQSSLSVPATYTGVFDLIRQLYAELPEAKVRHFTAGTFSFANPEGACRSCQGYGRKFIQMHFLPDLEITCDVCGGKRYNEQVLQVRYRGYSIADILELSAGEALRVFADVAPIRRILQTLCDVGLEYLPLGQPATTLSGGEAQRVKLAAELARPQTGRTLYILDEPTTGLHFEDLAKLIEVLQRFVDLGNTVLVIEHNLDLVKVADWVIDLGPEGGERGGYLVAEGTPEDIVRIARAYREKLGDKEPGLGAEPSSKSFPGFRCYTGEYLEPVLASGVYKWREPYRPPEEGEAVGEMLSGLAREEKPPWEIDGRHWHTVARVDRSGQPCLWEGKLLEEVVDYLESTGKLGETIWNKPHVVEIYGPGNPPRFFFQAITCELYVLRMLFYSSPEVFQQSPFVEQFGPKEGVNKARNFESSLPRVFLHAPREGWQCVEVSAAKLVELDLPEFWEFVSAALEGYLRLCQELPRKNSAGEQAGKDRRGSPRTAAIPKEQGKKSLDAFSRRWHLSLRGFPRGKRPTWPKGLLKDVLRILRGFSLTPDWNHPQAIKFLWEENRTLLFQLRTKHLEYLELRAYLPAGARISCATDSESREDDSLAGTPVVLQKSDGSLEVVLRLRHRTEPTLVKVASLIGEVIECWNLCRTPEGKSASS